MRAFCRYTRKRSEPAHGDVSNLHTKRREGRRVREGGGSLLSLFPSLFLCSVVLFPFSLSLVHSSFSPLSATMTMITRPVGSLCVHTALTCLSVRVHGHWPIPCLANMFASCKKQLSWHNCGKPRAIGNEVGLYLCWKWVMCLCLVV